ncbi:17719_t:CDS:2, partial [Gigaspora rosea]
IEYWILANLKVYYISIIQAMRFLMGSQTMTEYNNIELVLKQQSVINSCSECPIITYEIVKNW